MAFWLKKIITLFFLPLHFALIAGTVGTILLLLRRREKLARFLLVAAVLALLVFSNKAVAILLIRPLESHYAPIPDFADASAVPVELASCRAIVVLGGGHSESAGFSRVNELSSYSLSRLAEAIRVLHFLPPDARLIVSGNAGKDKISHAQILAEAAASLGVSPERIIRLDTPRDTEDEARELHARLGGAPFALVTSAWHLPRAMALCRGAGGNPVPCPADFLLKPGADTGARLLLFDLGSLERSTRAIHEYLGLFWAELRGQS